VGHQRNKGGNQKNSWNLMKMKVQLPEPMGYSKAIAKEKVNSHESIY
jgi:hypothetical protein